MRIGSDAHNHIMLFININIIIIILFIQVVSHSRFAIVGQNTADILHIIGGRML